MNRGGPTRLGIGLMILIMAIVVIGGFYLVGKFFFNSDNQQTNAEQVNAGQQLLDNPTDLTAVRMSVRGPITAEEAHYSIVMTMSGSARELVIFRGYDGSVMTQESLGNSAASFSDLLAALNRAGMMQEVDAEDENQGICAVGQLIQFEVFEYQQNEDGSTSEKSAKVLWTTSCAGLTGSFGGLSANVVALFLNQIPDARNRITAAKNDLNVETRAQIGNPWDGLAAFEND